MSHQSIRTTVCVCAVLALIVLAPAPGTAQPNPVEANDLDRGIPRTPWGAPDLQGVWDYRTMTPLERPREFADKKTLTTEEAAEYERLQGERLDDYDRSPSVHAKWWLDNGRQLTADNRTSLIISPADGRLPASTEESKTRAARRVESRRLTAGVEDRSLSERCITFGIVSLPRAYNNNLQVLQTPTSVALVSEMIHNVRAIPLDGRPRLADDIDQWDGDARGHWDGDTLVVETTNFSPKGSFRDATEDLHLVERFTRVGPDRLDYEVTVDDARTWDEPWTALVPLNKSRQPMFEYACHEGNRGLHNIIHNARFAENVEAAHAGSK